MKMIFEENIENEDFLELILNEEESEILCEYGVVTDFPKGLRGKRSLNVFIRLGNNFNEEDEMPLVKGKEAKTKKAKISKSG